MMCSAKSKDAAAPAKILKYMLEQNRPYSTIDVFMNLHKEFGKTCVQRTLDQLVAEGKVMEKVYGKQKVYSPDQSHFPEVSESELKEMDRTIAKLQDELKASNEQYQKQMSELTALKSSLTAQEAEEEVKKLDKECAEMELRLEQLKSGSNKVSPAEVEEMKRENGEALKQWRKRKRMANDIVEAIMEGFPKSKKELCEEVGIETDEDLNVKLPS